MLVSVDPARAEALFTQVASSVRREIVSGAVHAGEHLPSARELAASLDVNLHTVLRAYQELRDEGLIELRRGRGAVVTPLASALTSLAGDIAALVAKGQSLGVDADTISALVKEAGR